MNRQCIFCNRENIANLVYEDDILLAFLDYDPINEGHVLVVPKQHYLDIDELPCEILSHLINVSKKIVCALKETYHPEGYSIMQNGGDFNDIGHFHLHIFPRYKGDGFTWVGGNEHKNVNEEIAQKIKNKIDLS